MNILRKAIRITGVLLVVLISYVHLIEPNSSTKNNESKFQKCIDIKAKTDDTIRGSALMGMKTSCDYLK